MAEYFDRYKWNPQLFRTPEELNAALEQFEVKDKKIKAIHTIGLAHNMQPWAYQQTMRTTLAGVGIPYEDIDSGRYSNIEKTLLPCEVVLCEPVVFVFEDDSTLEIKPDGKGGLLLASNQISPFVKDGLNHSNVDSEYLFGRAIGCSIREIWTTKTHAQTEYTCSGHGDQDDTSKWKFWMTGEYDLYFHHRWGGWYQFGITSDRIGCHDGKITYSVIKEAANRYMQIPIVEGHDGSSYFWIMPVRHIAVSDDNWNGIEECREQEISIEEDDIGEFLYYFLDKYIQSLDEARNADAIDEKKYLFLRTHKVVLDSLMDITKGDYARFNSNTYLEVYEDIQEKALKKYKDEAAAHAQTQEAFKNLEKNSSDEIEALKARIATMEENEKKRQEDVFNKKASVWGWVATLILAGIPYLLLVVVIEIIKTQFSNISWRSAYGIAGTFIATTIAGIFFATGKKWCFKKVRSILEKREK